MRNALTRVAWWSVLVWCAIATPLFAAGSKEGQPKVARLSLIDPAEHPHVLASERFAKLVGERTNGQVEIQVYPNAQLGFANDSVQGLQTGTLEMFAGAVAWLGPLDPNFWITSSLYVFNDQQGATKFHQGQEFAKMKERMVKEHGIRLLNANWNRGPRHFISKKPIRTLDDLQGLKIRVPELKSWIGVFKLAGTNPTPIALSETFTALQQGLTDATEQSSNWLYFNKFYTIAPYITKTYHNYEEAGVMVSEEFFQSLSPEQQDILQTAAKEVGPWHNEKIAAEIKNSEAAMKAEGVTFIDVDLDQWRKKFRGFFMQQVESLGFDPDIVKTVTAEWM